MRIAAIKMSGFRGVRGEVSLQLPPGFAVIAGRNGTGKSTICDAIEFAISGQIRPSADHTEKGEGISDYIWWRGGSPSSAKWVELTLVAEDGTRYSVRRTPTEVAISPNAELDRLLCADASSIDQPIAQLCRTSILRDEEITRLSVDLKEADRFEFVRRALGTSDFTAVEDKAREVQELLKKEMQSAENDYSRTNSRVAELTSRLSQAKTEAMKAADAASAEGVLRTALGDHDSGLDVIISEAEARIAKHRLTLDALNRLYKRLQQVMSRETQFRSSDRANALTQLEGELKQLQTSIEDDERESSATNDQLNTAQAENPRIASLAQLREHGERIGLSDGHCPLCGSTHTDDEFRNHLTVLSESINAANQRLSAITKRAAEIAARLKASKSKAAQLKARIDADKAEREQLDADRASIVEEARSLGVTLNTLDVPNLQHLADDILIANETDAISRRLSELEQSLAVVQSSKALELVTTLEQDLQAAKEELVAADKRLLQVRKAQNQIKEAVDTIRRVRGEFVNEQLAQLEPLLIELYQRLRPHVDRPEVRYRLRGDVRKMLSFEVGDGLNPSFVFSSGQRRAAGLAFLLAVHLSRNWCKLSTLILDDPVQHIDDYRALHLTEVLASVRKTGRQVICTVEDESLGRLLARRLRSEPSFQGVFVKMAYSSRVGVHVESATPIEPLRRHVLVPAVG